MSFEIKSFSFQHKNEGPIKSLEPVKSLLTIQHGTNWPVVYILHNDYTTNKNLYVGESTSASQRMMQHVQNQNRNCFNQVKIIFDPTYNKSAVLDIEQTLINLFVADGQYELQNANEGQSDAHDYYDRAYYQKLVQEIWDQLQSNGTLHIKKPYNELANSALFKFSPYTSLTMEQNEVCMDILNAVLDAIDNGQKYVAMVQGGPGTGKSIVMMHMFHMLKKPKNPNTGGKISTKTGKKDDTWQKLEDLKKRIFNQSKTLNIAYVCPMFALQSTIRTAVKAAEINKKWVMLPINIANNTDDFDVLFVDEAHRLARTPKQRLDRFKKANDTLFGAQEDNDGKYTQLDWLLKKSKCVVMVFDEGQTVRDSDILVEERELAFSRVGVVPVKYELKGQMRCNGGSLYTDFIRKLLNPNGIAPTRPDVGHYDLQVFDDPNEMIEEICQLDKTNHLCRVATGFGWQWNAKSYKEAQRKFGEGWKKPSNFNRRTAHYISKLEVNDGVIELKGKKYVRNIDPSRWMIECDPHEIGCVHTTQGFDFNYIGVIFGPEIDYNPETKQVFVDYEKIADKSSLSVALLSNKRITEKDKKKRLETITRDVLNVYNVLLTRGIRGCFMWAINKNMQNYLKEVFNESSID